MSGASAEALQQLLLARSRDRASLTNNRKKKIRKKLSRVSKSLPEEVREEMCLKRKRDEDAAHASVNCSASRTASAPPQASSFTLEQQTALRQARKRLRAVSKARAASNDVLRSCFTGCPPGDGSSSRDTLLSSMLSMDSNDQVGAVRQNEAMGNERNWRASCSELRCGGAGQAKALRGSGGYSTTADADGGASGVSEQQKPPQHLRVLEMAHEASNVRLADATAAAATARAQQHAASSTTSSPVCAGSSIETNELVGKIGDAAVSSTATEATQVAMPSLSVATSSGTSGAGRGEEVTGAGAPKSGGWEWKRTNMSRLAAMVAAVEDGGAGIVTGDGKPGVELEGSRRQASELLGSSQGGAGQDWSDLARVLSGGNGARALDDGEKGAMAGGNRRGRFAYGNYRRYYGYRLQEGQSEDPRVGVMESGWFNGRRVLDIGCNEGVVTLQAACRYGTASMTGVDIDSALIRKACTLLKRTREEVGAELRRAGSGTQGARDWAELRRSAAALGRVWFQEMDWVAGPAADRRQLGPMDTVLCLSVTKWVHLHAGDTGLHTLFLHVWEQLAPGGIFVLEPQPWKSYRNAFRNRKVERGAVVDMEKLQLRPESFQDHLEKHVGFVFVRQLAVDACSQGFRRPLLVFCKPASAPAWHHSLGRRRP